MKTTISTPRDGSREHDNVIGADYVYRTAAADKAVRWFPRYLRHVEGRGAGQPFHLREWQADFIRALYGWRLASNESIRRYRRAYLEIPRGNGKSMLAAALGVKGLIGDGQLAPSVIGAATDRQTAGIVFGYSAKMVRAEPKLADRLKVIDSVKRIVRKSRTGIYQVLSADASRAYGYHPTRIIFDELHAQRDRGLYDVLATSQVTVDDALMLNITTAGFDRQSICWEVHQDALRACENPGAYPDLLASVYAAEDGDDIEDPAVWEKSNPNLGVSVMPNDIKAQVEKGRRNPAFLNTVMRLHFNVWTQQDVRWMPMREWDACAGMVDEAALVHRPCFAALDLAQVNDIAAFALVFPPDDPDVGEYQILVRAYVPDVLLAQRPDYAEYVRMGLLTATPGPSTNFGFIREDVKKAAAKYQIQKLGYDRMFAAQIIQELEDEGLECVPLGQGWYGMSRPTKELMRLVLARRVRHGGNPLLRWTAENLVVVQDAAGNLKPDKSKSGDKIDPMVAVIMGVGLATGEQQGQPDFFVIGRAS